MLARAIFENVVVLKYVKESDSRDGLSEQFFAAERLWRERWIKRQIGLPKPFIPKDVLLHEAEENTRMMKEMDENVLSKAKEWPGAHMNVKETAENEKVGFLPEYRFLYDYLSVQAHATAAVLRSFFAETEAGIHFICTPTEESVEEALFLGMNLFLYVFAAWNESFSLGFELSIEQFDRQLGVLARS